MRFARIALATLFVLNIIPISESGSIVDTSTRTYLEGFDALATGSEPCTGITDPTVCFYFVGHLGSAGSNQVETAPTGTGFSGKSWSITDAAVPYTVRLVNSGTGVNLCTAGQTNSVDILAPDLTATDVREIRWHSGTISNAVAPTNSFGLRLTGVGILGGTNTANFFAHGATLAATTSGNMVNTVTTAIHIQASQVNCANTGCVVFTFTGLTGLASPLTQCATNGDPFTGTFNNLAVADTASIAAATVHVDNYVWSGAPIPATGTPTIDYVYPVSGVTTGGTTVYIYGTNFATSGPTPVVRFCSIGALTGDTFVDSSTVMHTKTPPNGATNCNVTVTNPDGLIATCKSCFVYSTSGGAPNARINANSPTSGPTTGGTNVTLQGTDFRHGAIASIVGGATFTNTYIVSDRLAYAITPANPAGDYQIIMDNYDPATHQRQNRTLLLSYEYGHFSFLGTGSGADRDGDGIADASDPDIDGDGVSNANDGLNGQYAGTSDRDADGYSDGPSVPANNPATGQPGHLQPNDNCPSVKNVGQQDTDGDGIGDACEGNPNNGQGGTPGAAGISTEDFETCPNGSQPSNTWYDFTTAGIGTINCVSAQKDTGALGFSLQYSNVNYPTGIFTLKPSVGVMCAQPFFFATKQRDAAFSTSGGVGYNVILSDEDATLGTNVRNQVQIRFSNTGTTQPILFYESANVPQVAGTFPTGRFATTWNHWKVEFPCAGVSGTLKLTDTDTLETVSVSISQANAFDAGLDTLTLAVTGSGTCGAACGPFFDNINIGQTTTTGSTVIETASLPFTGITGYDVDASGQVGIVRYESGDKVQTFNGAAMDVNPNTPFDSNCQRSWGVSIMHFATDDAAIFLNCQSGTPSNVIGLEVRGPSLQAPFKPQHCQEGVSGDFCVIDIDDDECGDDDMDQNYQVAQLFSFPFDYSQFRDPSGGAQRVITAWGFTTLDGGLGVSVYTHVKNFDDECISTLRTVSVGQVAELVCATYNHGTQQDLIYAAAPSTSVVGYDIIYQTADPQFGVDRAELHTWFSGGVDASKPTGIGCAEDKLLIINNVGTVRIWNTTGTKENRIVTDTCQGAGGAGAAIDPTARVFAYECNNTFQLRRVDNLALLGTIPKPSGSSGYGLRLADNGNTLFFANNAAVYRFKISAVNPFTNETVNPDQDQDGDGLPDSADHDIDGDGVCNSENAYAGTFNEESCVAGPDPDIDGNGVCNEGLPQQPVGTLGAPGGCRPCTGNCDDDGDGIPNNSGDTTPGGIGSGPSGNNLSATGQGSFTFGFEIPEPWSSVLGVFMILVFAGIGALLTGKNPIAVGAGCVVGLLIGSIVFTVPLIFWVVAIIGGIVFGVAKAAQAFSSGA